MAPPRSLAVAALAGLAVLGLLAWWRWPTVPPAPAPLAVRAPVAPPPKAAPLARKPQPLADEAPAVEGRPPPDPKEPTSWHAWVDAPRWRSLHGALAAVEHPMAEEAGRVAEEVATASPDLDEQEWALLLGHERNVLGYLSLQELDPELNSQVSDLQRAVENVGKQPRVGAKP